MHVNEKEAHFIRFRLDQNSDSVDTDRTKPNNDFTYKASYPCATTTGMAQAKMFVSLLLIGTPF